MNHENEFLSLQQLERLKQATIINYLSEIKLNNNHELYEALIKHLFCGDFDDVFTSSVLVGLDSEEKKEICKLAQKYKELCFYQGNIHNWIDSIEGVTLQDEDFVCGKLLEDYDFLLRVTKAGGEEVLKELLEFQDYYFPFDSSVINRLRSVFQEDTVLLDTLVEMVKPDGKYRDFSEEQKAILCLYPNGVIFTKEKDSIHYIPVEEIMSKINEFVFGMQNGEFNNVGFLKTLFSEDPSLFEDVIFSISSEYMNEKEHEKKK